MSDISQAGDEYLALLQDTPALQEKATRLRRNVDAWLGRAPITPECYAPLAPLTAAEQNQVAAAHYAAALGRSLLRRAAETAKG